jgi:hypothetical protein
MCGVHAAGSDLGIDERGMEKPTVRVAERPY